MSVILVDDVSVCIDCAALLANDDTSALCACSTDPHAEDCPAGKLFHAIARRQSARVFPSQYVVTCDGENDHDTFSRTPCDYCGTILAGDRCRAAILVPTNTLAPSRANVPPLSVAVVAREDGSIDILSLPSRGWRSAHRELARTFGATVRRTAIVDRDSVWTGWVKP